MLEFTERQHAILCILSQDRYATNKQLADQLNISPASIVGDLMAISEAVGVKTRIAMPEAARKLGWQSYVAPSPESMEHRVRRLMADSFAPGPLKELCLMAETCRVHANDLTTLIWLSHESNQPVGDETLDRFVAHSQLQRAALNRLDAHVVELRKVAK